MQLLQETISSNKTTKLFKDFLGKYHAVCFKNAELSKKFSPKIYETEKEAQKYLDQFLAY